MSVCGDDGGDDDHAAGEVNDSVAFLHDHGGCAYGCARRHILLDADAATLTLILILILRDFGLFRDLCDGLEDSPHVVKV